MEKPNRVKHLYGYTVCLVAVVTALISINGGVQNAVTLSNPAAAASSFGDNIASFEAWMASRSQFRSEQTADTSSVTTLRARFEALRESRIAQEAFRARRDLITNVLLLSVAIGLFVTHWRWLRRIPDNGASAA